jgi:hypothetical protein
VDCGTRIPSAFRKCYESGPDRGERPVSPSPATRGHLPTGASTCPWARHRPLCHHPPERGGCQIRKREPAPPPDHRGDYPALTPTPGNGRSPPPSGEWRDHVVTRSPATRARASRAWRRAKRPGHTAPCHPAHCPGIVRNTLHSRRELRRHRSRGTKLTRRTNPGMVPSGRCSSRRGAREHARRRSRTATAANSPDPVQVRRPAPCRDPGTPAGPDQPRAAPGYGARREHPPPAAARHEPH